MHTHLKGFFFKMSMHINEYSHFNLDLPKKYSRYLKLINENKILI